MINSDGPIVEHNTPIAIVNQAFASFQSSIVNGSQNMLVNHNGKTYSIEVFFGTVGFNLHFDSEIKTILMQGLYIDFNEISNDIKRWFIAKVSSDSERLLLGVYDIHSYFRSITIGTQYQVISSVNLSTIIANPNHSFTTLLHKIIH